MNKILLILLVVVLTSFSIKPDFKSDQRKYSRVREAYSEKEQGLKQLLSDKGISTITNKIFLRAYKKERILEVWVENKELGKFIHLKDYNFCEFSGSLGPKRKQGDMQTPEGFYHIDRFNPYSNFHLSLGINYPNKSDRILSKYSNLGGDIFIHGACCTIGCMPITDDKIKELYILAVEAKNAGQSRIPVHILPAKLSDNVLLQLEEEYSGNKVLEFWKNLKQVDDYFNKNNTLPNISIDSNGKYNI